MRVIIQLRHSNQLHAATTESVAFEAAAPTISGPVPGLELDHPYASTQIPKLLPIQPGASPFALAQPLNFSMVPEQSTYVVRGRISDDVDTQRNTIAAAYANPNVVGVYADPVIESCPNCPAGPVGTSKDVAKLLNVAGLSAAGLDGQGVLLAVVDTGINLAYLATQHCKPKLDAARSWTPAGVPTQPGAHPKNHGSMCAYDVNIAAPKATLLDYAVLLSQTPGATAMSGLLSDAVKGYSVLLNLISGMPAASKALVVSNSWGMFSPSWDFPIGNPGNYSDNAAHPFNVIVASLESAGADILFAAGNCGRDCPDGRCQFGTTLPICGANSHPKVLSIAGIDTHKVRVGYSSQGPGRLSPRKPDLATYTHFKGSLVYPADAGTSAACPVAAGVVAAIRSKYPVSKLTPMQLRSLLFKTAEDLGGTGFDYDYGWGALNPKALLSSLKALKTNKTASTGNGHARLTQPGKTRKGLPKHHAGMGI
jgi:subtilisin family serine protease